MQKLRNELSNAASPYLLQHQDNPVHWQMWGTEALSAAKERGQPILLSIGYAACHWCHVMAHESFEDEEVAALMNENYVNIKVDREERPDVDAIYMNALQMLGQQGGWPLTMFLTPTGEPFWGGTYFPKEPKYGQPGFKIVLKEIAKTYAADDASVEKNTSAIMAAIADRAAADTAGEITVDLLDAASARLFDLIDPEKGGLKGAPKFPQTALLECLWRAGFRAQNSQYLDAVNTSLERMCQGGIYDHLGGGFARYSVDDRWLAPHFEKMLYDNALMVDLLTSAYRATGSALFAQRVEETIDWVGREMTVPGGGFAASLDADSEGEEGKFYVWSSTEIESELGKAAPNFCNAYDVSPIGNWEGKTILNRLASQGSHDAKIETEFAAARAKLLAARGSRVRPGWDDKVLADWNGLMISAIARAGAVFQRSDWLEMAKTAFNFVMAEMAHDKGGLALLHSTRAGTPGPIGVADDYANIARAALALHEAEPDSNLVGTAEKLSDTLAALFWDEKRDGYYFTADNAEALIARDRTAIDGATPNANGVMADVLMRLYFLTGRMDHRQKADRIFAAFGGALRQNFPSMATLMNSFEFSQRAVQVVITGARGAAELRRAVWGHGAPNILLIFLDSGAALDLSHPAYGKEAVNGQATAYVCVGPICSLPCTDENELKTLLDDSVGR
jgi:hypothetical protein